MRENMRYAHFAEICENYYAMNYVVLYPQNGDRIVAIDTVPRHYTLCILN